MKTAEVPIGRGLVVLVDADDVQLVSQHRWYATPDGRTCYAKRDMVTPEGRKTKQPMHALITGFAMTDHINGNGLDNRRENLREVTHSQNMFNRKKLYGSSRYKGVTWVKRLNKWGAQITHNRRSFNLGCYLVEEDAALAYDRAARERFGEYAALNFPRPGETSARHTFAA